jgi:hypothetical protein
MDFGFQTLSIIHLDKNKSPFKWRTICASAEELQQIRARNNIYMQEPGA